MKGTYLVQGNHSKSMKYQKLSSVTDYDGSECIVIKHAKPEFALLLQKVKCIITSTGSSLAHLCIVARERGIPVILSADVFNSANSVGTLELKRENDYISILL
jgi:phosphohistidine swiveling domain-containing protein